jgi:heterotetrameric sarcosine oxidase delta subunit
MTCPFCGPRDEAEFRYGGDPDVARPDAGASAETWSAYLYFRENRRGVAREYWVHAQGCSQWLIAERNTLTHEILSCEIAS